MKVSKESILALMKRASKVANGRSILPIYNHVAIDFDGAICRVTASDSVRVYAESISAEGDPCKFTLESVKLTKALSGMKSGDVEITNKSVKQGKTNIKLDSMDYDAFPIPNFEATIDTGLHSDDLASCISIIGHAMPTKDVRVMLNGIHLTKGFAVATDGHRMAFQECAYDGPDIIIPAETARSMPDIQGDIFIDSSKLVIRSDNAIYSTGLVDAKFPDWRRIIPTAHEVEITVNKGDILNAIKTVQIGGEMVKITASGNTAEIKNDGAVTEIDVSANGDIEIGFMSQYLIDAISQCIEVDIVLKAGPNRACVINDNFIVMPVRI